MTQYFRVTAYHPAEDLSVIIDANGMYQKLWELSSFIIQKGFKILEISNDEKFLDGNITKTETNPDNLILRAHMTGKPENLEHEENEITYHAVRVAGKFYIPDKDKRVLKEG